MTHAHRQWHRRALVVLGFLLPFLFALGLLARRSVPVMPGTTAIGEVRPEPPSPP